ncbi:MAG TPA: ABC transporter ATP-binding protein [Trueperaceae bacterium]|nr:ABC transporter ATP-binding protein [Trueperaceae bacterium]
MGLSVERLSKSYGTVRAVADVTLGVPPDSTLALLGPSGCGKSTLLKLVAGLERPDEGRVLVSGRDVTDLPPQRRDLGMVFQDFALFPHLSVADNVAFGLVERRWPAERRRARVAEMLKLVGLEGLGGRRVTELSGGQQQRVALARAMAPEPGLLLLDEPLSNLDEALRAELREEVARLLASQGAEAVYVTHDQVEAFAIADTVAVMRAGRIVQVGTAHDLLTSPADAWTARFLGHDNVWEGAEARRVAAAAGLPAAPTADGALLLRMEEVRLTTPEAGAGGGAQAGPARAAPGARGVVGGALREGLAWRLRLDVPAWGATVTWRGHERELGGAPAVGAEYELLVPAGAWLSLPAAREP